MAPPHVPLTFARRLLRRLLRHLPGVSCPVHPARRVLPRRVLPRCVLPRCVLSWRPARCVLPGASCPVRPARCVLPGASCPVRPARCVHSSVSHRTAPYPVRSAHASTPVCRSVPHRTPSGPPQCVRRTTPHGTLAGPVVAAQSLPSRRRYPIRSAHASTPVRPCVHSRVPVHPLQCACVSTPVCPPQCVRRTTPHGTLAGPVVTAPSLPSRRRRPVVAAMIIKIFNVLIKDGLIK